jgi:hypothetical protein
VVVLQFDSPADVSKIQILSHQSKIASSIELFIGNPVAKHTNKVQFKRLGYIDTNAAAAAAARVLPLLFVGDLPPSLSSLSLALSLSLGALCAHGLLSHQTSNTKHTRSYLSLDANERSNWKARELKVSQHKQQL